MDKLSTQIIKYLEIMDVEYIFGIPSGNTAQIYDSLYDSKIKPIFNKHEEACVFSASGYSRSNDYSKLGVALLCGGVGVANAVNGIADAYRNEVPLLIISGAPSTKVMSKGSTQDLDTIPITQSITKYSTLVTNPNKLMETIDELVTLAMTKPYGPVHVAIPMDMTSKLGDFVYPSILKSKPKFKQHKNQVDTYDAELINHFISKSNKGLILVGKGAYGLKNEIDILSKKLGWYITTTPQGKSNVDNNSPYYIGNFGFFSTDKAAEYAKSKDLDLVLAIGTSLGENATLNFNTDFLENKKIIQLTHNVKQAYTYICSDKLPIICDVQDLVKKLVKIVEEKTDKNPPILDKESLNDNMEDNIVEEGVSLTEFMKKLPSIMKNETTYICDIGEFMNYTSKYLLPHKNSEYILNLNYGSMGSGICSSVGTALGTNNKCVVILGDGTFNMNGLEVLTAKEYNIPIVYFVINNARYNYVHQGLNFLFGRCTKENSFERLDISKVSKSLGIKSYQINNVDELFDIKEELNNSTEPIVVELVTTGKEMAGTPDRFKTLNKSISK